MKKTWKKCSSLLLTLAMMASLCMGLSVVAFAAEEDDKVVAEFKEPVIQVSDQDQEVALVLKTYEQYPVASLDFEMNVLPEGWEVVEVYNDDITFGPKDYYAPTRILCYYTGDGTPTDQIATCIIKVPANTPAGEYTVGFINVYVDGDYGRVNYVRRASAAATLTIEEPKADAEPSYTVAISDNVPGTAEVKVGDEVTMNVTVSGDEFATVGATVTYDAALFELMSSADDSIPAGWNGQWNAAVTNKPGTFTFSATADSDQASGTTVATLTFKAIASGIGDFSIEGAGINQEDQASKDIYTAVGVGDSVKVLAEYTVTFENAATYTVTEGSKLTKVPANPAAPEGKTFQGWSCNGTIYSAEDIKALTITSNMTFAAVYSDVELTVTVKDQDNEVVENTVTYGQSITVQISDYDPDNFEYTVTVDGTVADLSVDETGAFILANIKADMNVVITAAQKHAVTVNEYVSGVTLVTVTGVDANYSYDGNVMYHSTDKDGNDVYLWLVKGNVGQDEAAELVQASAEARVELNKSGTDVNATGTVDLADWGAAFSCYKVAYNVEAYMALYLRADVNGDNKVDLLDVVAVMSAVQ